MDATSGQRGRVQQAPQLGFGQPAVLQCHVQHRALFLVGTLGNRRSLLIADDRVQCGDQDRITRQCLLASQQALARELPAFKPYATMDQSDVDDCGKNNSVTFSK